MPLVEKLDEVRSLTVIQIFAVSRAEDRRLPLELKTLQFPGGEVHVTVGLGVQADELHVHAHVPDSNRSEEHTSELQSQ